MRNIACVCGCLRSLDRAFTQLIDLLTQSVPNGTHTYMQRDLAMRSREKARAISRRAVRDAGAVKLVT